MRFPGFNNESIRSCKIKLYQEKPQKSAAVFHSGQTTGDRHRTANSILSYPCSFRPSPTKFISESVVLPSLLVKHLTNSTKLSTFVAIILTVMRQEGSDFRDFQLQIVRMRIAFRQCVQQTLKRHNIHVTFEMLQVLSCLWREQGATQQILAERTAKSKASLSSLMTNMEKRGYIERREKTSDRRNKRVYLTPEGERLWMRILPVLNRLYARLEQTVGLEHLRNMSLNLSKIQDVLENI